MLKRVSGIPLARLAFSITQENMGMVEFVDKKVDFNLKS
jgi:hypothetical protein